MQSSAAFNEVLAVGHKCFSKTVPRLFKKAGLSGNYTYHSLRTLQHFELGNAVDILNRIMFDLYQGLPHLSVEPTDGQTLTSLSLLDSSSSLPSLSSPVRKNFTAAIAIYHHVEMCGC